MKLRYNPQTGIIKTKAGSFSLNDLYSQIADITAKSVELSKQITKNPYYPRDLGLNVEVPRFIQREVEDLEKLQFDGVISPTLSASIDRLKRLRDPEAVSNAFWKAVGQTYGVSASTAKKLAPKGNLTSPIAQRKRLSSRKNITENATARYPKLVEYMRDKIPHIDERKLPDLSQRELLGIWQDWQAKGTIPREVVKPFTKKTRE